MGHGSLLHVSPREQPFFLKTLHNSLEGRRQRLKLISVPFEENVAQKASPQMRELVVWMTDHEEDEPTELH